MAAPTIQTDLVTYDAADGLTGWNGIDGGKPTYQETDFYIQGNFCVSDLVSTSGNFEGLAYGGAAVPTGSDTHFLVWIYSTTPSLLDTLSAGGMRVILGTATTAYVNFHVQGRDTYQYGGWKCYPVRYRTDATASPPYRTVVGSPGTSPSYAGGGILVTGAVKGTNLGVDAVRYGTGIFIYGGDTGTPASFMTASEFNDLQTNRYGILQSQGGGYLWQGKLAVGQNSGSIAQQAYFVGSNATLVIDNTPHALPEFTQLIVDHTGTVFNLTNITFQALGTNTPGRLIYNTAPSSSILNSVTFANFGETVLKTNVTANSCIWRASGQVTQSGSIIDNCTFNSLTSSVSLVSNAPSSVTNCTFISDGSNHAIQITTSGSCSFVGHSFTGYVAGTGSSDTGNEVVYNTSGGPVTISVTSGDAPSVRNSGSSTTTIITGQKTLTLTGIISGSEVRLYPTGSTTELAGQETVSGTFQYTYTYAADQEINIVVFHTNYLPIYQQYTLGGSDASLPINQITDRQYLNP